MSDNIFACVNTECVACQQGLLIHASVDDAKEADKNIPCQACGEGLRFVSPVLSTGTGWQEVED